MARRKSVNHFVAVSDLSQAPEAQEGILIEVEGQEGDTPQNRKKALEILGQMWEKGEIEADQFPDGLADENILYVPISNQKDEAKGEAKESLKLPPIVQGAQEIVQLTRLQVEIQEIAEEAAPYVPIIQAILDRSRPLTVEEKEIVKDKKYGKTLEKLGSSIAEQEDYHESCTGQANLILNAIAWQLGHGVSNQ
jgi:hypothetical protein